MEIITGLLLGLSTLLFVGPVFFYLLKSTLSGGVISGIAVAVGIIIGDIIYVIIILKGLGDYLNQPEITRWLALAGGLILLALGTKYLFAKYSESLNGEKLKKLAMGKHAFNGFVINFVNPFVLGVWVLFLSINTSKFDNQKSIVLSLITTLVVIFVTDILKVLFAEKLKRFLKPRPLKLISKLFGIIMLVFGLRLLLEFF